MDEKQLDKVRAEWEDIHVMAKLIRECESEHVAALLLKKQNNMIKNNLITRALSVMLEIGITLTTLGKEAAAELIVKANENYRTFLRELDDGN